MSRVFGFEKMVEQISDEVAAHCASVAGYWPYGDTPIEKLFSATLCKFMQMGMHELKRDLYFATPQHPEGLEALLEKEALAGQVLLQLQPQLDGWRPDFIVHAYADWARFETYRPPCWRRLIVECDGHDFHERTKEQASKDRSRDRWAQGAGYEIFRFTGSELWRDPLGCVKQVINWAEKGI